MSSNNKLKVFTNGFLKENPVLVLVLGTCPTLATSTMASNGIGMGLAATFVLVCSNIVISALRKIIPNQVRIPCYITVIAGFVSVVQMLVKAFVPALDTALGVYLPLIVVNCIILGRAEAFSYKNGVVASFWDGIFQGIGYTAVLVVMCVIREFLGAGTIMGGLLEIGENGQLVFGLGTAAGIRILPEAFPALGMILPVGGFLTLACLIAAMQYILNKPKKDKKTEEVAK